MKCETFDSRLQNLLDERASLKHDKQLDEHAHECSSCRETLSAAIAMQEGLDLFEVPELPADFSAKVVSRAQPASKPANSVSRATMIISAIAVVAALLLVAVIPFAQNLLKTTDPIVSEDSEPANPNEVVKDEPVKDEPSVKPSDPIDPLIDHNDTAIAQNDGNDSPMGGLSGGIVLPELPSFGDVSEQTNRLPGIRPIRSSFGVVFGLFRRALPGGNQTEKPQAVLPSIEFTNVS